MAGAVSNPTRRVVVLLDFLAQRPGSAFSLSELSRELQISKSTLHPLVETLVDAGYLLRDAKTRLIQLGPVLAALGHAALGQRGALVDSLRPAMEQIARDLDAHCVVSAVFGDWIVPVALAGEPSRVTTVFRVGARSNPFAPPMGILFLPGRPMGEIQEWLDRAQPSMTPAEVELHLSAIDLLRANGFAAATRLDAKARLEQALDGFHVDGTPEQSDVVRELLGEMRRARYMVLDFTDPESREIDWIGIPLLDHGGRVQLALVVLNLPHPLSGPDILKVVQLLRTTVGVIPGVRLLQGSGT